MVDIRSWKVWVIFALALGTLACANREERRERKEMAREERRERAEARRAERLERTETRRAERTGEEPRRPARETRRDEPKVAEAAPPRREDTVKQTTASSLTPTSTAPTAQVAQPNMVFMRAVGGSVAAAVFDVTSGQPKLVGILYGNNKLVYPAKAGMNTFMVVGEAADFMQVDASPGKSYYALLVPRTGVWRPRWSFEPLRGSDRRISGWDRGMRPISVTAANQRWADENANDVTDKHVRYWAVWSTKPERERAAQSLTAEDGR